MKKSYLFIICLLSHFFCQSSFAQHEAVQVAGAIATGYEASERVSSKNGSSEVIGAEFSFWYLSSDMQIKSSLGDLIGTDINFGDVLGVDESIGVVEFNAWLRLLKRHRINVGFVPFRFDGEAQIEQSFDFSGVTFNIEETITTDFDINWFNVFYEFDIIYNDYGILGLRIGGEFLDVDARLESSFVTVEAEASVAAPAVGVYAELYVTGDLALEGRLDGFILDISDIDVTVFDFRANLRYDINDFVSVAGGFHSLSFDLTVDEEEADVSLYGPFISGSVRF